MADIYTVIEYTIKSSSDLLVQAVPRFTSEFTREFEGSGIINSSGDIGTCDVILGDVDGDFTLAWKPVIAVVVNVEFGSDSGDFMSGSRNFEESIGITSSRSDFVVEGEG